jgi:tRNA threonylcarbamoyladenosine biosynthesis protein TsaB
VKTAGYALAIETSNPSATVDGGASGAPGVAVARVENLDDSPSGLTSAGPIRVEQLSVKHRGEDDLLPAIDRLVRAAGFHSTDLALVAVSVGPGGFTALRIAVTVAKALALATGARCVPVPTACALASKAPPESAPLAVLLAGKGASAFATIFDHNALAQLAAPGPLVAPQGKLVTAEELEPSGLRAVVADAFLPPPIQEKIASLGIDLLRPEYDAAACLALGLRSVPVSPESLAPIYPREPEAVEKWRRLHGAG